MSEDGPPILGGVACVNATADSQPRRRERCSPQHWGAGGAAAAYDAIAAGYDEQVRGDAWMRDVLWTRYQRLFQPDERVLDVGCGTGLDALFLARRGLAVTGIDVSPAMIARLREQAGYLGLADRIETRALDYAALGDWPAARFDGIISAFAGLSTAPDLAPFAADAARLLRPGGRMLVHLLNQFSVWEWLLLVTHGQWPAARRLGRQRERVFTIGGQPVRHYLWYPSAAYQRFFARDFALSRAYSLGVLRPPHTLRRLPTTAANLLGVLEQRVNGRRPFVNWGRFFVLELARRDDTATPAPRG
jgi:SAM-dependent methyltransferase